MSILYFWIHSTRLFRSLLAFSTKSFVLHQFLGPSSSFFCWFLLVLDLVFLCQCRTYLLEWFLTKQSLNFLHLGQICCSFVFSQMQSQKLMNLSILGISLLGSDLLSIFLKSLSGHAGTWCCLAFSFRYLFPISHLINQFLLCNSQIIEDMSLPICTYPCFQISFSLFVAFLLTFLLKRSLLILAIHCRGCFSFLFKFCSRLFSPLAFFFAVLFRPGCFITNLNTIAFPIA